MHFTVKDNANIDRAHKDLQRKNEKQIQTISPRRFFYEKTLSNQQIGILLCKLRVLHSKLPFVFCGRPCHHCSFAHNLCPFATLIITPPRVAVNMQGQESRGSWFETRSGVWYPRRRPCGVAINTLVD